MSVGNVGRAEGVGSKRSLAFQSDTEQSMNDRMGSLTQSLSVFRVLDYHLDQSHLLSILFSLSTAAALLLVLPARWPLRHPKL